MMQHLNRLPGFSAEKSIVKSTEKYSTTSYANYMTSPSRIVPLADVCESGDGKMGCACSCGCVAGPYSCDCMMCPAFK